MTTIQKRSVMVAGHRTSVSLEAPFWEELSSIAARRGKSISTLISEIDSSRDGNLSSALRLLVLEDFRQRLQAEPAGFR